MLKILETFVAFFKKTPNGNIFKILFRKFSSRHRSTCCVQILWHLADGKSIKSCVAYLAKKKQNFAWLSSSRYCETAPKICQGQPPAMCSECSRFHPNRFTFDRVIAERV